MTQLSKFLKKLRIDYDETQLKMCEKIGCSTAFMSRIEYGSKAMPNTLAEKIIEVYSFTDDEKAEFKRLIFRHNNYRKADLSGLSNEEVNFILDYIWDRRGEVIETI